LDLAKENGEELDVKKDVILILERVLWFWFSILYEQGNFINDILSELCAHLSLDLQ